MKRFGMALVAALATMLFATVATADRDTPGMAPKLYKQLFDAVIVRPLGLVPIAVAPVGCLVGLPVALVMQSPVDVREVCFEDPIAYTFRRPLGNFSMPDDREY